MFRALARSLVDLVYPRTCPACRKISRTTGSLLADICLDCWRDIRRNTPPFCSRCGRHLSSPDADLLCPGCRSTQPCFDRAFSPCVYDGPVKKLMHQLKYGGKDYLAKPLTSLLVDFIRDYRLPLNQIDAAVAMPLYRTRLREREFNQAESFAAAVCREFGIPLLSGALLRHRVTRSQTGLTAPQRAENVRGAFLVPDAAAVRDKRLILVDDVLTTGSTASEAARALKGAQAAYVLVLTLAS